MSPIEVSTKPTQLQSTRMSELENHLLAFGILVLVLAVFAFLGWLCDAVGVFVISTISLGFYRPDLERFWSGLAARLTGTLVVCAAAILVLGVMMKAT